MPSLELAINKAMTSHGVWGERWEGVNKGAWKINYLTLYFLSLKDGFT